MQKYLGKAVVLSKVSITSSTPELREPKSIQGEIGYQLTTFNTVKLCHLTQTLVEVLELAATQYHLGQALTVDLIQELVAHLTKEIALVTNILLAAYS